MAKKGMVSQYELNRMKNIEDNNAVLKKLMSDLKNMEGVSPRVSRKKTPRASTKRRESDSFVIRRNPARNARYTPTSSPPMTRARRGSLSSASSSSSSTSTSPNQQKSGRLLIRFGAFGKRPADSDVDFDPFDDEDELEMRERHLQNRRQSRKMRDIKSVEDITEEDLKMVAEFVSDKRYDAVYGSTCHQCRQKTFDQKTICRDEGCFGVRGQFCGPCLRNRYGEEAKEALKDPDWVCPPCRGICNCSFCRKKSGKSCTGILIHAARESGFEDVNSYLQSLRLKKA